MKKNISKKSQNIELNRILTYADLSRRSVSYNGEKRQYHIYYLLIDNWLTLNQLNTNKSTKQHLWTILQYQIKCNTSTLFKQSERKKHRWALMKYDHNVMWRCLEFLETSVYKLNAEGGCFCLLLRHIALTSVNVVSSINYYILHFLF